MFFKKLNILFLMFTLSTGFILKAQSDEKLPASPVNGLSMGFADLNKGTTGGRGGETVTVTDRESFINEISGTDFKIIQVSGKIELYEGRWAQVGSNKTIIGINNAVLRYGGLYLSGSKNVIIKNITFQDAVTPGTGTEFDNIHINDGASNIWIDHCTFSDDPVSDPNKSQHHDGLIDIKNGANYITVSYSEFHNHDKTSLIGHDDKNDAKDKGKLKVTFHHNFFNGTYQRHPRVRFGRVHVYNNYYLSNNYGVGIGTKSSIYSEKNYFENTKKPFERFSGSGMIKDINSIFDNSSVPDINNELEWSPDKYYIYTTDEAKEIKNICIKHAGANKPER